MMEGSKHDSPGSDGMLLVALRAKYRVFGSTILRPQAGDAIAAGRRTAIIYIGSSEQNGPLHDH
jgi:hypothetical protein